MLGKLLRQCLPKVFLQNALHGSGVFDRRLDFTKRRLKRALLKITVNGQDWPNYTLTGILTDFGLYPKIVNYVV